MMAAAAMGATAFQKGLGAIHALSHPVGALYDTHHGMTNAVFMPYVLAFNRKAIEEQHQAAGGLYRPAAELSRVPRLGAGAARGDRRAAYAGRPQRRRRQDRAHRRDGAGRSDRAAATRCRSTSARRAPCSGVRWRGGSKIVAQLDHAVAPLAGRRGSKAFEPGFAQPRQVLRAVHIPQPHGLAPVTGRVARCAAAFRPSPFAVLQPCRRTARAAACRIPIST